MKICPFCSAQNPDDSMFCLACGQNLSAVQPPVVQPEPVFTPAPVEEVIPEPVVYQPVPEPLYQPAPEIVPQYQPVPEPVYQPAPEPVYQPVQEPVPQYQPVPEPVYSSIPEPVYQPVQQAGGFTPPPQPYAPPAYQAPAYTPSPVPVMVKPPKPGDPSKNWAGILGMILGILSLLMCCLPYISIFFAIAGLIFSIMGRKSQQKGMAIAGLITSIIGLLVTAILLIIILLGATEWLDEIPGLSEFVPY